MIVSLHLPKTAGSSFKKSLHSHFGDALFSDYDDRPLNMSALDRQKSALEASLQNRNLDLSGIDCIHGHFLPMKYLYMATAREVKFVTWLRNPVDRLLSHYNYWQQDCDLKAVTALRRKVIEESWSLENFCLADELKNFYGTFLWAFPISNFDFIGITEFYQEDFSYFSRHYFGREMAPERVNIGRPAEYSIDSSLRKKIEGFHQQDMALYQYALEKRECRK